MRAFFRDLTAIAAVAVVFAVLIYGPGSGPLRTADGSPRRHPIHLPVVVSVALAGVGAGLFTRRFTANSVCSAASAALFVSHPAFVHVLARPGSPAAALSAAFALSAGFAGGFVGDLARDARARRREAVALLGCAASAALHPAGLAAAPLLLLARLLFAPPAAAVRPFVRAAAFEAAASFAGRALFGGFAAFPRGFAMPRAFLVPSDAPDPSLWTSAILAAGVVCVLLGRPRGRPPRTVARAVGFACFAGAFADLPNALGLAADADDTVVLQHFGVCLAIPVAIYRAARSLLAARGSDPWVERPFPAVPALRDALRDAAPGTHEAHAAPAQADVVAAAVAAAIRTTVAELRASAGPRDAAGAPAPPSALWDRLLAGDAAHSAAARAAGDAEASTAAWRRGYDALIRPRLRGARAVLVAGPAPAAVLAAASETARVVRVDAAAPDEAGARGAGLESVADRSVDAALCFEERGLARPADLLALLRGLERVTRPGGPIGIGHADAARPGLVDVKWTEAPR